MESRRGAFHLLDGRGFYQNSEVPIDYAFLGVDGLGNTAQKHCHSSDVLVGPSELWETTPLIHDVMLDLMGMTLGATRRARRMGCNVSHRLRRRRQRLVLPSLS